MLASGIHLRLRAQPRGTARGRTVAIAAPCTRPTPPPPQPASLHHRPLGRCPRTFMTSRGLSLKTTRPSGASHSSNDPSPHATPPPLVRCVRSFGEKAWMMATSGEASTRWRGCVTRDAVAREPSATDYVNCANSDVNCVVPPATSHQPPATSHPPPATSIRHPCFPASLTYSPC